MGKNGTENGKRKEREWPDIDSTRRYEKTYRYSNGRAAGSELCVEGVWSLLDDCDDNDMINYHHHHHHYDLVRRRLPYSRQCADIVPDKLLQSLLLLLLQLLLILITDEDASARPANTLHAQTICNSQTVKQSRPCNRPAVEAHKLGQMEFIEVFSFTLTRIMPGLLP